MKTTKRILLATAVWAAACATAAFAAVNIGAPAPDFSVTDIQGKVHRLSDYKGRTVVLEWVNPECPFVQKHYGSGNIPNLQKSATGDGVVWLAINSGRPGSDGDYDDAAAANWLKAKNAAPTAYVRDQDGKVGRLYGAKTTPHLYVINADGALVYNGAIDSIRSADVDDIAKAENYVNAALAAVKTGKPVAKSSSQPYGCAVKY
jgi:hypothetical protein